MTQIPSENDDDRSVAASDIVQFGQPGEVPAQQEARQHEQPQFGLHQNQDVVETKMIESLKEELAKLLSTQNEQHQQEKAQLEGKNRKLGEKLSSVELQTKGTTENGTLDGRMGQLKGEFSKVLAEQQKQWMAQFQAHNYYLEQKLKEAEQRARMEKNELEEAIRANQQKMEKFRQEMEETGSQVIDRNQKKLDDIWGQLVVKSKIAANPRGIVWDGSNTAAVISKCGLKVAANRKEEDFGCGLLLNSKNELAVFFTHKGLLMGRQIRITPTVDRLYPTVVPWRTDVEANFGDNLVAKPFKYDIGKCPGLVFEF